MTSCLLATDAAPVAAALGAIEGRCDEIILLLDGRQMISYPAEARVKRLYIELKRDLRAASLRPLVHEPAHDRQPTPCEALFYRDAVSRALDALQPAANAHPLASRWLRAVQQAQAELVRGRSALEAEVRDGDQP